MFRRELTVGSRRPDHLEVDMMRSGDFYLCKKQKSDALNAGGDWPKDSCNYSKLQFYKNLVRVKKVTAFLLMNIRKPKPLHISFSVELE